MKPEFQIRFSGDSRGSIAGVSEGVTFFTLPLIIIEITKLWNGR